MSKAQREPGEFACTVCGTCLRLVHTPGAFNYPGGPYLPLPACSICGGTVVPLDDKAKLAFKRIEDATKLLDATIASTSDEL